VKTDDRLMRTA